MTADECEEHRELCRESKFLADSVISSDNINVCFVPALTIVTIVPSNNMYENQPTLR